MIRKIIFVFCMVFLVGNVFAIGVTPLRNTFKFEPGIVKNIQFKILNNNAENFTMKGEVIGDLAEFIELSQEEISFTADEKEKIIGYSFRMPNELSEGNHKGGVLFVIKQEGIQEVVGVTLGVKNEVVVEVDSFQNDFIGNSNVVRDDFGFSENSSGIIFAIFISGIIFAIVWKKYFFVRSKK